MDDEMTFNERLDWALALHEMDNAAFAKAVGPTGQQTVNRWRVRGKIGGPSLPAVRNILPRINTEWLQEGIGERLRASNAKATRYEVREPSDDHASDEIKMLEARGSCGGGSIVIDMEHRPPLIKEATWFRRFKVAPKDALAVWADGDSMADFIVDGDIVIFDTSKTRPVSGKIFLLDHPDGLRIKRLRRDIEGKWYLESTNPDKRTYPDEIVPPDQSDLLKIRGQFVYRQGG